MIIALSLIIGGASAVVLGSIALSKRSEFKRCPSCGSLFNDMGSVIKYCGYAAKFRSQHLNDDPFERAECSTCKQKQL